MKKFVVWMALFAYLGLGTVHADRLSMDERGRIFISQNDMPLKKKAHYDCGLHKKK